MAENKGSERTKKYFRKLSEKALIGEEGQNKLGTYKESTGGGTPIKKGEDFIVVDNPEEADKIRKEEEGLPDSQKTNIRVKQPRNEDGTFGYNSQNKRGLRYESRGKTIPDFLRKYAAKWYREGKTGEDLITSQDEEVLLTFDMTGKELIERCKYYIEKDGMFSALAGKGDIIYSKKAGGGERSEKELESAMESARKKRAQVKKTPFRKREEVPEKEEVEKVSTKSMINIDEKDAEDFVAKINNERRKQGIAQTNIDKLLTFMKNNPNSKTVKTFKEVYGYGD